MSRRGKSSQTVIGEWRDTPEAAAGRRVKWETALIALGKLRRQQIADQAEARRKYVEALKLPTLTEAQKARAEDRMYQARVEKLVACAVSALQSGVDLDLTRETDAE